MAEAPPAYSVNPVQTKVVTQGPLNYYGLDAIDAPPPAVTVQPMGAQPQHTTVIVNQPMAMPSLGPRLWSSGICGCFDDMSSCCLGWLCPCILGCNVATDMGEAWCVPFCIPGGMVALRTKIRTQNNIQGSVMDDGCTVLWCGTCMVCQMSRELTYVKNNQLQNVMTSRSNCYVNPTTVQ